MSKPSLFFLLCVASDITIDGYEIDEIDFTEPAWQVLDLDGNTMEFRNQEVDFSTGGYVFDVAGEKHQIYVTATIEVNGSNWSTLLGSDSAYRGGL